MRPLSIRQPHAEEILRGIKTVEYRVKPCRIIGERFYIYAGLKCPPDDELRRFATLRRDPETMPTGVLVGTAVITKCIPSTRDDFDGWEWHLSDVRRLQRLKKPARHPQPSWFWPFRERHTE